MPREHGGGQYFLDGRGGHPVGGHGNGPRHRAKHVTSCIPLAHGHGHHRAAQGGGQAQAGQDAAGAAGAVGQLKRLAFETGRRLHGEPALAGIGRGLGCGGHGHDGTRGGDASKGVVWTGNKRDAGLACRPDRGGLGVYLPRDHVLDLAPGPAGLDGHGQVAGLIAEGQREVVGSGGDGRCGVGIVGGRDIRRGLGSAAGGERKGVQARGQGRGGPGIVTCRMEKRRLGLLRRTDKPGAGLGRAGRRGRSPQAEGVEKPPGGVGPGHVLGHAIGVDRQRQGRACTRQGGVEGKGGLL